MPNLAPLLPLLLLAAVPAQDRTRNPALHVAYVGELQSDRGKDFVQFLRGQFARVDTVERADCTPARLRAADVVVLDWPQPGAVSDWVRDKQKPRRNPLGELARWDRPTVLLGSAGLNVAADWNLPGAYGRTCLHPFAYGLRDHVLFTAPHALDVHATEKVPAPLSWREATPGLEQVEVLRLFPGEVPSMPGWCTAAGECDGPEIEVLCGGLNTKQPTHAAIWRQGNLLHFGFEPAPAQLNATGRGLLLNAIAYISRFTSDRPIVRERGFVDPVGSDAPSWRLDWLLTAPTATAAQLAKAFAEPWRTQLAALDLAAARAFVQARRGAVRCAGNLFDFDPEAEALGVDLRREGVLRQLVERLDGPDGKAARALLERLAADGREPGATANQWRSWLQVRENALCFDPHSHVWRLDPLAFARDEKSRMLRGPARADGDAVRDPAALALAAKVEAFHGGARALDDLHVLLVDRGQVRMLWDRDQGLFRMENHGTIPAGNFATPWTVAVVDTAADADLIRGGGPPPRPFVAGRSDFRDLVERLFLPLLLTAPGTSLQLLEDDAQGRRQLQVRLGGRAMDPRKVHVLHVDPASGAVQAIDVAARPGSKPVAWQVGGTLTVGPLRLPNGFVRAGGRGTPLEYAGAVWNATPPAGVATTTELVLGKD